MSYNRTSVRSTRSYLFVARRSCANARPAPLVFRVQHGDARETAAGTGAGVPITAGALLEAALHMVVSLSKGIIQTTVALSDGSAVNVTLAKYQTPSGADINKVGLRPDGPSPLPDAPATAQGFCDALAAAPSDARAALFR